MAAEYVRIEDLCAQLESAYRDLATFSGQSGGSRQQLLINEARKKVTEAVPHSKMANLWISKKAELLHKGEEELTEGLSDLEGALVQSRRTKEQLMQELASMEQQVTTFREQAISRRS
ncbi:hypothetical protein MRB56_12780 [Halomonas cupida]|uniref:hypothetical protein n=1 Tax=Halomonas cupida TaxID=44933 RepID=UPI0039B378EB